MKLTAAHREALHDVLTWRRDVRHFRTDPIPEGVISRLREAMDLAPSVGNARPWRVIEVQSDNLRRSVRAIFETANAQASKIYEDSRKAEYDALKLAGLQEAPLHLAIFTDHSPAEGHGLGRQTMPEMLDYSTVTAIHTLWLAARVENIGVGWVSILDPTAICRLLEVPPNWSLTGYLCIGYAQKTDDTPLLHRTEWQVNTPTAWTKA